MSTGSASATEVFEQLRPRLRGVAYRMTGSVSDAEDICQECWLRWAGVDHAQVRDTEAFLVSVATRLAIDRQRQAAVRRESYTGPYLPEPLVSAPGGGVLGVSQTADPAEAAELADSLTYAFLVLLDELDPVERAVVLLHDVFGYPFASVADAVDKSEPAVRKIASRARRRLREEQPRSSVRPSDDKVGEVLASLLTAVSAGDVKLVMSHMAPDVVEMSDGGAVRRAGRRPVIGPERVSRLLVNLAQRGSHLDLRFVEVNARPGLLLSEGDEPFMAMSVDFDEQGRINRLFSVLNPDKLVHLGGEGAHLRMD